MCQFDPGRPVTTEGGPQAEHHSPCLVEGDLVVGLLGAAPAECLVERTLARQVAYSERHHTDALFHAPSMARAAIAWLWQQVQGTALEADRHGHRVDRDRAG